MSFLKSLFGRKDDKNNNQPLNFQEGSGVESLNIKVKTKIVVGLPVTAPPQTLVDSIAFVLSNYNVIKEGYLFAKKNENSPVAPILTLGIYFDKKVEGESLQQIMNNIVSVIDKNINKGEIMDIIIFKESELFTTVKSYKESLIYSRN